MTLEYAVNKCKYFCFANSLNSIKDQLPENKTIYLTKDTFKDTNPEEQLNNILNIIKELDSKNEYYFVIDSELEAFNDISFKFDSSKNGINSENVKRNVLDGISLGSSTMIDAISTNQFVIVNGKRNAGLDLKKNNNNDVIDALATNGLFNSPKVMSEYSIGKILLSLSKFDSFKIFVVHSSLKALKFDGNIPTNHNVPRYAVGHGEILSVWYRYLSLLYYCYFTPLEMIDPEHKYDI